MLLRLYALGLLVWGACGQCDDVCGPDTLCDIDGLCKASCPEPPSPCCSPATSCTDDSVATDCVCTFDPFCCQVSWDTQCVQEAQDSCGLTCNSLSLVQMTMEVNCEPGVQTDPAEIRMCATTDLTKGGMTLRMEMQPPELILPDNSKIQLLPVDGVVSTLDDAADATIHTGMTVLYDCSSTEMCQAVGNYTISRMLTKQTVQMDRMDDYFCLTKIVAKNACPETLLVAPNTFKYSYVFEINDSYDLVPGTRLGVVNELSSDAVNPNEPPKVNITRSETAYDISVDDFSIVFPTDYNVNNENTVYDLILDVQPPNDLRPNPRVSLITGHLENGKFIFYDPSSSTLTYADCREREYRWEEYCIELRLREYYWDRCSERNRRLEDYDCYISSEERCDYDYSSHYDECCCRPSADSDRYSFVLGNRGTAQCDNGGRTILNARLCTRALEVLGFPEGSRIKNNQPCYVAGGGKGHANGNHRNAARFICSIWAEE